MDQLREEATLSGILKFGILSEETIQKQKSIKNGLNKVMEIIAFSLILAMVNGTQTRSLLSTIQMALLITLTPLSQNLVNRTQTRSLLLKVQMALLITFTPLISKIAVDYFKDTIG